MVLGMWLICAGLALQPAAEPTASIVVIGQDDAGDAERINAAIEASPEGAEILLRGRFLLTAPVRLLGDRAYRGDSRAGTVLRQADGAGLPALMVSASWLSNSEWTDHPLAVRHLRLDGNRAGNPDTPTVGLLLRAWLTTVEDVHIRECGSDGIRLTSVGAEGGGLRSTQVNGRLQHLFIDGSGRHGIYVEDPQNQVTDWILADSWIAGSREDGIRMENAAGWMVQRNHIYGVGRHAIDAQRAFGTVISDNYIEGFGESRQPGTFYGLRVTLQGDSASTISGNRIFNHGGEPTEGAEYRYLGVSVNYGHGVATISGNAIRGSGTPRGVGLRYTTDGERSMKVVSVGNVVESVAVPRHVGGDVVLDAGL